MNILKRQLYLIYLIESQRALNNRFESLKKAFTVAKSALIAERTANLESIRQSSLYPLLSQSIEKHELIPLKQLLSILGDVNDWKTLEAATAVLREQRALGAPLREEVQSTIISKLEQLYESNPDQEAMTSILIKLVLPIQFSPLGPVSVPPSSPLHPLLQELSFQQ